MTAALSTVPQAKKRVRVLRRRVYAVLEQGDGADGVSLALNRFLILLIVATLTATVIESVPEMANAYALPLSAVGWTATLVFSLEYAARLWSAGPMVGNRDAGDHRLWRCGSSHRARAGLGGALRSSPGCS